MRKNLEQIYDMPYWVLIDIKTGNIISYQKKKYKNVKAVQRDHYFLGGYR